MENRFDISAGELKFNLEAIPIEEVKKEEIPTVTLAPFTNHTKIFFEDVIVGTTSSQKVIVSNPSAKVLHVSVKSLPPNERHVKISWESNSIPGNGSVLFEITWSPLEVDSWMHTITLQFGRCLRKDLPVIFKSIPPKKMSKKQAIAKNKSPKRIKKENTIQKKSITTPNSYKSIIKTALREDKENVNSFKRSTPKIKFSLTTDSRRETYDVNDAKFIYLREDYRNISNDSLEIPSDLNNLENIDLLRPMTNLNNIYSNSDNCIIKNKAKTCNTKVPCGVSETDMINISSETYVKGNISSETYTKNNTYVKDATLSTSSPTILKTNPLPSYVNENINSVTYVQGNISSETYIKSNLSSNTYVKDTTLSASSPRILKTNTFPSRKSSSFISNISVCVEDDLNLSPIFISPTVHQTNMSGAKIRNIIEADMWEKQTGPCFDEYSPSRDLFRKRKSDVVFDVSPAKKPFLDNSKTAVYKNHLDWNKTKKVHKSSYASTSIFDPFTSESFHRNEQWLEKQETIFKNWLNALLTPPAELDSNMDDRPINVAKLWQECKQKSVPIAPTKENVSIKYHTNNRLDSLRKSAFSLFRSSEVAEVLDKISLNVENEKLSIRADKNVHLDLGLQSEVMTLLLSYNPLWLRIALETIYNTCIGLNSNSDIMGLSNFLMQKFFKDPFLLQKHKTIHSPKYTLAIKKFILKKFLELVYFLDLAKCKVLIGHDPCLFRRNAPVKESREIILAFSRELLSSVGDVTRLLRIMGYVVNHKQTYLHEFNYSVVHLGVDLRDGIRLTKVMEIILIRKHLTGCLRVPAVSRLQKIHNMKLVFDALLEANFEIVGDISPKDIVDGHHEKTLSFLWQIIYKFQAPLMVNAAIQIQNWWRSLAIVLKRRMKARRKRLAAIKIQNWYRRHLHNNKHRQLKKNIILIQSRVRGYLLRNTLKYKLYCIVTIQAFVRMWIMRKEYLRIRATVINLQQVYRAKQLMVQQKEYYQGLKASALTIQRFYRGHKLMTVTRQRYLTIKAAVITIQLRFRALLLMKSERSNYQRIRCACITVQKYFRSYQVMKKDLKDYSDLKSAAVVIQKRFRANQAMKIERTHYKNLKKAVLCVQFRFRAHKKMREDYVNYQHLKKTVLYIQSKYRATRLMKIEYASFNCLKSTTIRLQRWYRANNLMKLERQRYLEIKIATVVLQQHFKAYLLMKTERNNYQQTRNAIITIQRYVRAHQVMKTSYHAYNDLKRATILIQRRFRSIQLMKTERIYFNNLKTAAIFIQTKFRAKIIMRIERTNFENLRNAIRLIQNRYRANHLRKTEYENFNALKRAAIIVQRRFRANKLMKIQRRDYQALRVASLVTQRRFRANKLMQVELSKFDDLKKATLTIQSKLRATLMMKTEVLNYKIVRKAVATIQTRYRANQLMKIEKDKYDNLKKFTIIIQRRFRARRTMKIQRLAFQNIVKSTVIIQRRYRATKLMQDELARYKKIQSAVMFIQTKFRANTRMKTEYSYYQKLRNAVMLVQCKHRANHLMKIERENFNKLKKSAIIIQKRFRANRIMKAHREKYHVLMKAVIFVQQKFRAIKKMHADYERYNSLKKHALLIQSRYRAKKLTNFERCRYLKLKSSVIVVQRLFRLRKLTIVTQEKYQKIRTAVVTVQQRFRAHQMMKMERFRYQMLKNAAITIQRRYRAKRIMYIERAKFNKMKKAVIFIQQLYRSRQLMVTEKQRYQTYLSKIIYVQRSFRANRAMKVERNRYKNLRNAVLFVQKRYRARRLYIQYQQYKNAIIIIQRRYRAQQIMKIQRFKFCQLKRAAIIIQRRWRKFVSESDKYKLKKLQIKAAIKLQAFWRGYKIRKEHPQIHKIRKNVEELTLHASSQNTLHNRKERAARILTSNSTLMQILYALEDLDFITRRCKNTLISMSETLPEQLYIFVSCANRSPAEMELSTVAVSILINIYKYQDTSKYAWIPSQSSMDNEPFVVSDANVEFNNKPESSTSNYIVVQEQDGAGPLPIVSEFENDKGLYEECNALLHEQVKPSDE
ncbi:hypothetical protein RN001_004523 [Aquatica leii]|uniref:Calponin-homology (CH) domain-containing protein n=1 Tax=Aquatica leii TaxID=1421715 RepID=A0AAN7SI30_9COLE|nr:hypothetical protein RN001_004523 [Aquatica leii]